MRAIGLILLLTTSSVVTAKEASEVAAEQKQDIRVVGRLNVNRATREQLGRVPGLDAAAIDALVAARKTQPIADLTSFTLPELALAHLTTDGESTFCRILQLPLVRLEYPTDARR
jgi:hypothetical protein